MKTSANVRFSAKVDDNLRSKCDWCDYHATLKETSNYMQIVCSSGIIKNDIKLRKSRLKPK